MHRHTYTYTVYIHTNTQFITAFATSFCGEKKRPNNQHAEQREIAGVNSAVKRSPSSQLQKSALHKTAADSGFVLTQGDLLPYTSESHELRSTCEGGEMDCIFLSDKSSPGHGTLLLCVKEHKDKITTCHWIPRFTVGQI